MSEQNLIERINVSDLDLNDIKGCYDPSKAGFDVNKYLALSGKKQEKVYWEQNEIFFNSPFNGGTVKSFLDELKYDKRFTEGNPWLLFTEGSFHSNFDGGITEIFKAVPQKIKETRKMWFFEQLRGYGFEHCLEGISGYGEPYSNRIDLSR